jgi:hypothetical protein
MVAEIHMLRTTAVTDREAAVHKLEKMLQHAREGHVQAVAVAWVRLAASMQPEISMAGVTGASAQVYIQESYVANAYAPPPVATPRRY